MLATLFFLLWWQQAAAPAKTPAATKPAAAAAKKTAPAGPKAAADLQTDLTAALHADPLQGDTITLTVSADAITLSGVVHAAEHKGVATRVARAVAARDGWTAAHVVNHLEVQLAHPSR